MRTVALVLLISFGAYASDAPVKVVLLPGEPAPTTGCFTDEETCKATGSEIARCQASEESLKQSVRDGPSPLAYLAGGFVLGLGLAAVGAYTWQALVRDRPP